MDVKIKFNQAYTVKNPHDKPESYKEGQTVMLNEASAMHFVKRGVADTVDNKPPAPPPAKK